VAIWDYHIKQNSGKKALPLPFIFPLVFYTGGGSYTAERQFWKLFGDKSERMREILFNPFHLINVDQFAEATLTKKIFAGTLGYIMAKRFRTNSNHGLHIIMPNMHKLESSNYERFVVELINYIAEVDETHTEVEDLIAVMKKEKISLNMENTIMSLADKLIKKGMERGMERGMEQGMEQGMEKGMERGMKQGMERGMERGMEQGIEVGGEKREIEIITKMLINGVNPVFIAKNTGVSIEKIKGLKKQLTQQEFLAPIS